jgi:prephenate dehydrogenase
MNDSQAHIDIGIIGFGQMGRFMASHFGQHNIVYVYDPAPNIKAGSFPHGVIFSEIERAAGCEIVFLFPGIEQFSECCHSIRPHLRPGAIVIECCSVMIFPVTEMLEILPQNVELIACHPLFGPQSGRESIAGLKVVLAPIRTSMLTLVSTLFEQIGVEIVLLSPEEHDQAMARTQALEQLIGKILMKMGIESEIVDVPGYKKLLELKNMLEEDSEHLFFSLQRRNPFAKETVRRFEQTLKTIILSIYNENPYV